VDEAKLQKRRSGDGVVPGATVRSKRFAEAAPGIGQASTNPERFALQDRGRILNPSSDSVGK
jgi:hypothetical protein